MSIFLQERHLTVERRHKIADALEFFPTESKYDGGRPSKSVCAFDFSEKGIYLPLSFAINELGLKRRGRADFRKTHLKFTGKLRAHQKVAMKEGVKILNKNSTCILALSTGFGKTCMGINIATKINMPTLIIISRLCLFDQWISLYYKVCRRSYD